ncbi:MAG TPA: LacI family DNA-binding transcriptional regulator [Candidatus Limnocylindrales bacterium]
MTSIADVARLAGVSTATASRVVSAADYAVSAATRERVLDAARALDYVPNALARGLQKSRVPVVGVIVHDITDPYFADVVRGVEDAAGAAGHLVITCSSDRDAERENSYVRLLRGMRAATVIFAGSGFDDRAANEELGRHLAAIRAYGGAVVHLSTHAGGPPEVGVDNRAGVAAVVAELVRLGHRRIAFLAGPPSLLVGRERIEGFRRGLAEAGLEEDERLVVPTGFDRAAGADGVDRLLATGRPFTAIAAANDLLALGALERLAALGIDVPDDVSVVGFDDIATAAVVAPSLSTVHLPLHEIGRRGFAFATRQLAGEEPAPEVLPIELVMRASTGPAPARALVGRTARAAS